MLRAKVSAEDGNRMIQDPNGLKSLEAYVNKVKPEAAYFYEEGGDRTFLFVIDLPSVDMMPVVGEPLFQGFNAKVEFHPAMVLEDVKKGVEKAK